YDEPDWNEVGIHWSPNQEIDLAGYNIYRADSSGGSPVQLNASLVQDTFWVDNSTANGVYYYYTVRAVDNDQNQSQISEEVRSRAISMDQGILIVDKTADGNGTPMNPTDQEVDDFFNALLSHYPVSEYDVNAEGGIKLADLGAFSSVVWHTNALSDLTLALEARESIGEYLDFGGNLLITSYQPTKVFFNNINYPASFSPGDFIYDYLKIAQVDFNPPARFYGAYPIMSGYDSVYVDTIKTAFATDHHLVRIESISAVAGADEIYRYDSQYASTTPQGSMKGSPVGVEYLGSDFRMIILSFPLYYMDLLQTQSLMSHIMSDKFSETTEVKEELVISPHGFRLSQNYPNPFNPGTIIEFSLPRSGFVTLTVFNTLGQQIATLISERLNAGNHRYYWNARRLASGLYFYKLETDEYRSIKKALLLK
nr:T9SS type A sorting domain-containing protein [Fodinibius sp.]